MPSDDVPTVRPSGSLALFEETLVESIEKLDGLPASDERAELRREAVATQALFRSWKVRTPEPKIRAAAVSRLMSLYRAVEELAATKR